MKFPLDLLPMALCGLATIVAVAVILVASDLLRRLVLRIIARLEGRRAQRHSARTPPSRAKVLERAPGETVAPGCREPEPERVSQRETLPG